MPMVEVSLTTDVWHEITDLDNPEFCFLQLDASDTVICAFDENEPPELADVAEILQNGANAIQIPSGRSAWLKLISGTASIVYSQFGGVLFDPAKCKTVASDGTTSEVTDGGSVVVGYPAETGTYPPTLAFLETEAAGLNSSDTVNSAILNLSLSKTYPGGTFRIHGIESATSQSAAIVDYADLNTDLPRTSAYADFTAAYKGPVIVDVAAIVQELLSASGWDTESPIQFVILPVMMTANGTDQQITINADVRESVIFITAS